MLTDSTQLRSALFWASDGRLLYATRDDPANLSRGDFIIWSLRVSETSGKPEGNPAPVSKGIGRVGDLSASADSKRLVLWRDNTEAQVFLTELDPEAHQLNTPRRFTLDDNLNVATAWTPDGRAVLLTSNRGRSWNLFRQAIDQVTPELVAEGGRDFLLPRLNPDGTQVLYVNSSSPQDPEHRASLMEVRLQGGPTRVVLQTPSMGNFQCARTPSKVCLFSSAKESSAQFFSFDPEDGKTQEFATFEGKSGIHCVWSLSPDGSQLAIVFANEPKVTFMAISDRSTHEVEVKNWADRSAIDWAADSRSAYVIAQTSSGTDAVLEVEPSGKRRVLLEGEKNTRYLGPFSRPTAATCSWKKGREQTTSGWWRPSELSCVGSVCFWTRKMGASVAAPGFK